METKVCTKCGRTLLLSEFNWRNKTKGTRRSECKYCHSDYMKQIYQKKKNEVQEIKTKCTCEKCGESRGYVLDFHHKNPQEKEDTIAHMTSNNYTLEKVYEEIKKCIVLCANCHREFHYLEKQNDGLTIEKYLKNDY